MGAWEQVRPRQVALIERYCWAAGCSEKSEAFGPTVEWPVFRYQHGQNPEHVLVVDVIKLVKDGHPAVDPERPALGIMVLDWLTRVHASELGS